MGVTKRYTIDDAVVPHWMGESFAWLKTQLNRSSSILLTDENVYALHANKFKGWRTIIVPAGEAHKQQATVDTIMQQLAAFEADRSTTLVAVGGGVVTDMGAYAAAIYMRGIKCILAPTTLLCMVDAGMGGKNGVDLGKYKNLVGTIRQSSGILFDTGFLKTLPEQEWQNGFAEIIKHASIKNAALFRQLEQHDLAYYRRSKTALGDLIASNVAIKNKIVMADPFEKGERKQLNFGHTIGHAIENHLGIAHGHAVAVGMVYAGHLSQRLTGFTGQERLINLIEQYGLPTHAHIDIDTTLQMIRHDKKRAGDTVHFVLLEKLGKALVLPIPFSDLSNLLRDNQ